MRIMGQEVRVLGFTGTRTGLSPEQGEQLGGLVGLFEIVHHGDCLGADAQLHEIARRNHLWIVVHPPTNTKLRAWCKGDIAMPAKPYLERNRVIVTSSDVLVATPKSRQKANSGTWYTVEQARKLSKPVVIIHRDGSLATENLDAQVPVW